MKRVLFLTNYPSPYRVRFFDELGKKLGKFGYSIQKPKKKSRVKQRRK